MYTKPTSKNLKMLLLKKTMSTPKMSDGGVDDDDEDADAAASADVNESGLVITDCFTTLW